jgi:hypothetical protein
MLLACQGQIYDGPKGVIGFEPVWRPDDHVSFFTAAEGWGVFAQRRSGDRQREKIELKWGKLRLRRLVFAWPQNAKPAKVSVRAAGAAVDADHAVEAGRLYINLAADTTLHAGEALEVVIAKE